MIKIIANSDEEKIWIDELEVGEEGYNAEEAAWIVAAMYELCRNTEDFDELVRASKVICRRGMEEYK